MALRVLVCGSRTWSGIAASDHIHRVMGRVEALAVSLGQKLEVAHGGCPSGADAIVDAWARRRGYEPIVHKAQWDVYGRAAGPLRNAQMAEQGADLCLAFLRDSSPGTLDMISSAEAHKIPTFVIKWEELLFLDPDVVTEPDE